MKVQRFDREYGNFNCFPSKGAPEQKKHTGVPPKNDAEECWYAAGGVEASRRPVEGGAESGPPRGARGRAEGGASRGPYRRLRKDQPFKKSDFAF